jgi:hypothetical protein
MKHNLLIIFTIFAMLFAGAAYADDTTASATSGATVNGANASANITGANAEANTSSNAVSAGGNASASGGTVVSSPTQNNAQFTNVGGQTTSVGDQTTTVGGQSTEVGGQSTDVSVDPTQTVNFNAPMLQDNSVHEAADLSQGRGFAIPGEIIFPGTPGYFGEATPGHRFIPLNKLLRFVTVWDAEKAKAMLKGSTGAKDIQIRDLYAGAETTPAALVYCSIAAPEDLGAIVVDQRAIGTVAATNKKSISADVLAVAIVKASETGSNFILFMAEGVNREVDAHGWGIGFHTTQASLHGGGNGSSNVSSGGLGYSRGWSGYIDYPWLQFTFLAVEGIDGLPIATAEQAEAEVVKE